MSSQTTSPGAGASGGTSSNTHTATSPRISRYYPPHFQPPHHYPSQPLIGINPHSVIASTIPITTSLPTAAINEGIIANGAINGGLPVTLGMGPQGSKMPKTAATVTVASVASVLASPPLVGTSSVGSILSAAGSVLGSAAVSPSSTMSGTVSGSSGNSSSIVTGLPYGIIMDRSDVNEVVGGGAEVVLGGDSVIAADALEVSTALVNVDCGVGGTTVINGVNGVSVVNGVHAVHAVYGEGAIEAEKEAEESERYPGDWASSRSSSAATVIPIHQASADVGDSLLASSSDSRLSLLPDEDMHEYTPKSQLGAWKDLRLVYAIVRIFISALTSKDKANILE